jgi:serine/threonine protein kinase/Leucine-rich repeat (LRR) protein
MMNPIQVVIADFSLLWAIYALQLLVTYAGGTTISICAEYSLTAASGIAAFCAFQVCSDDDVILSSLPAQGGYCGGDNYFALYNASNDLIATNDNYYQKCAVISFHQSVNACHWYNLRQSCVSGSCNGTTAIWNGAMSSPKAQEFALLALPLTTASGQALSSSLGWDVNNDASTWTRIAVDATQNVVGIDLEDSGVYGALNCNGLHNLPFLTTLNLANNHLAFYIPSCISSVTQLIELDLSSNSITGSLPSLPAALTTLLLSDNSLTGQLPDFPAAIEWFDVDSNSLDGTIPPFLNWASSANISMRSNSLVGTIPSVTANTCYLDLSYNKLTGAIPDMSAALATLDTILLAGNSLSGQIPSLPSKLTRINLENMGLSGTIPELPSAMTQFYASGNSLSGSLPSLPSAIAHFLVSNNRLSGTIAPLPDSLTAFEVAYNSLTGKLPTTTVVTSNAVLHGRRLYTLPSRLVSFVVDHNALSGPLPESLPSSMVAFAAGNNAFTGSLPSLDSSTALALFDVSHNRQLGGTLPSTLCSVTSLKSMMALGNNFTCYEPCFPGSTYFDYLSAFTLYNPTTIPNYKVCMNEQLTALCDINDGLGIAKMIFGKSSYVAETVTEAATFTSAGGTEMYPFVDNTANYAGFDLYFGSSTLAAYTFTETVTVCTANCSSGSTSGCTTYNSTTGLPGLGAVPVYSTKCREINVTITAVNDQSMSGASSATLTVIFYLARYAYWNFWECDSQVSTTNPCTWMGIDCVQNQYISRLHLSSMMLMGTISPSIGNLTYLNYLDLSSNFITGGVPSSIGNLANVLTYLDVSNNAISEIPSELGTLTGLTDLNLDANVLSGTVPTYLANLTQLEELQIRSNAFTGKFPSEFCRLSSTYIQAQGNYFSCYEGCYGTNASEDRVTFSSNVGYCAPTSYPTSFPTAPTPSPVGPPIHMTTGAYVGVAIAGAVLLICLGCIYEYEMFLYKYSDLPLHKRLIRGKKIEVKHVERYENTLFFVDSKGNNLMEFYFIASNGRYAGQITKDALVRIIECSLNIETGTLMHNDSQQNYAWALLVQAEDDISYAACEEILHKYEQHVYALANCTDKKGRRCIDIASVRVKDEMNKCMYLFRRFELYPGPPEHKSATSVVVFAVDHKNDKPADSRDDDDDDVSSPGKRSDGMDSGSGNNSGGSSGEEGKEQEQEREQQDSRMYRAVEDNENEYYGPDAGGAGAGISPRTSDPEISPRSSVGGISPREGNVATVNGKAAGGVVYGSRKVALKFMKHRHQFLAEIETRTKAGFDDIFVISVLEFFDGDDTDGDTNVDFRKAACRRGFADYPYCVVMVLAESSLKKVIDQQHIAGEDWDQVRHIIKTLCNCLVHIHEKNIVHGDLKPSNMVIVDNAVRLIDLDACSNFSKESTDYTGLKYSSAYLPPELFYWHKDAAGNSYYDVRTAVLNPETGEFKPLTNEYELVKPSPAQDMWAVGVILYLLCTKQTLFQTSLEGNIARADTMQAFEWSNRMKEEKLSLVEHKYARNLLSLLLSKDPTMRPSAQHVLCHPFISGQHPQRMQGEEAQYDVFLSYRVSSDSKHVEMFYNKLTEMGLKVWWDRMCLLPGQPWEEGFCNGLVKSSCFVCLLSKNAINNPDKAWHNFTKFDKHSKCDNVLLEWRLAIELRARQMIEGIFPIFIGGLKSVSSKSGAGGDDLNENFNDPVYTDYFPSGCHPNPLPAFSIPSVEQKLREHLERQSLGSALRPDLTVQEVVSEIVGNQGGFLRGQLSVAVPKICTGIQQMCERIREEQAIRAEERELFGGYASSLGGSLRSSPRGLLSGSNQPSYRSLASSRSLHDNDDPPFDDIRKENEALRAENLQAKRNHREQQQELKRVQEEQASHRMEFMQELNRMQRELDAYKAELDK